MYVTYLEMEKFGGPDTLNLIFKKMEKPQSQVKSRPCDVRFDDDLQQIEGFLRGTHPEWCIGKQGLSTASDVKGGLISEGIFTLVP